MTHLAPIDPAKLSSDHRAYYDTANARDRMLFTPTGHAPELMGALHGFANVLTARGTLPGRLVELVRLRIAFHNQCRSCMAMRYSTGLEDGLTEDLVCSLEKPHEASDLTPAEKAALAYADIFSTNHFAIDATRFTALRQHFTEPEIVELGLWVGYFLGFGRMVAAWDMSEELPGGMGEKATPWNTETFVISH